MAGLICQGSAQTPPVAPGHIKIWLAWKPKKNSVKFTARYFAVSRIGNRAGHPRP